MKYRRKTLMVKWKMGLKMSRGIFVTENSINAAMLIICIIYSSLDFLTDFSWGSMQKCMSQISPLCSEQHTVYTGCILNVPSYCDIQEIGEFGHSRSWSNKLIAGMKRYNSNRKSKKKKKNQLKELNDAFTCDRRGPDSTEISFVQKAFALTQQTAEKAGEQVIESRNFTSGVTGPFKRDSLCNMWVHLTVWGNDLNFSFLHLEGIAWNSWLAGSAYFQTSPHNHTNKPWQ